MLESSKIEPSYRKRINENLTVTHPEITINFEYNSLINELQTKNDTNIFEILWWLLKQSPKIIKIIYILIQLIQRFKDMKNIYDTLTTVLGIVVAIAIPLIDLLKTGNISWESAGLAIVSGLFGYFTNKAKK